MNRILPLPVALWVCCSVGCASNRPAPEPEPARTEPSAPARTQPPSDPPARSEPASRASRYPYAADALAAHNEARATQGLPPLAWSDDLANFATEWARHLLPPNCSPGSDLQLEHRQRNAYGENLFGGSRSDEGGFTVREAVADWLSEAPYYNLARNSCRSGRMCGHYTQVLWRNTQRVGCGTSACGGSVIWVCNYDPPGNYEGERPY